MSVTSMWEGQMSDGLTTRAAAELVGVPYYLLNRWVAAGLIPGLTARGRGTSLVWLPEHIDAARRLATRRRLAYELAADAGLSFAGGRPKWQQEEVGAAR